MTSSRLRSACVLLALVAALLVSVYRYAGSRAPGTISVTAVTAVRPEASLLASTSESTGEVAENRRETLRRLAYAQGWNDEEPAELAAFRDWTRRYEAA